MSTDFARLTAGDFQNLPGTCDEAFAILSGWQETGRLSVTFEILGGITPPEKSPGNPAQPDSADEQDALTSVLRMAAYAAEAPLGTDWLEQRGVLIMAALARQCKLILEIKTETEKDDDVGNRRVAVEDLLDIFYQRVGFTPTQNMYFSRLTRGDLNISMIQAIEKEGYRWFIYSYVDWPLYRVLLYAECRAQNNREQSGWLAEDENKWAAHEAILLAQMKKRNRLSTRYEWATRLVFALGFVIALGLSTTIGYWLRPSWVGIFTGAGLCLLSWLIPLFFNWLSEEVESAGDRHLRRLEPQSSSRGEEEGGYDDDSAEVMCLDK